MKLHQEKLSKRRERHFGERVVWCFEDRPSSLISGLIQSATAHDGRVALVFDDRRWTYAELLTEIRRASVGLQQLGVQRGDRVIMLIANRPEFVTLFYAIQWLGAIAVPVDVRLKAPEVKHVVNNAGGAYLLHDEGLIDRVPDPTEFDAPLSIYAVPQADGVKVFPDAEADLAEVACIPNSEDDVAAILYTSGSTGKPKGAALTHLNMAHSVLHHSGSLDLDEEDRIAIGVPLSHATGLMCGVVSPLMGGSTLLLSHRFKAAEFLAMAARHRMTYTVMVPAMYSLCLRDKDFDRYDLSSWRVGHFGGAPMPPSVVSMLAEKLPALRLVNGYGSTETCGAAIMTPRAGESTKLDSVGKPLACIEVVVMNPETCVEVNAGETGEIWIRSPGVVPGYWNNPDATTESIVSGFWRSGDVGRMDADGYVYVLDRLKDMINRGGYKIYSAVVENVLLQIPGVLEAALVGRPDPVLGERVHAFVSTVAGSSLEAEAVRNFCSERLADYEVPETLTISATPLPRNAAGKLAKLELRAMAAQLPQFVKPVVHSLSRCA